MISKNCFCKKKLPNAYSLFLSFSTVSTKRILLFSILKYRIQKMIPDAYLNLKYSNCKTPFSISFLLSENTDSKTIPNRPLFYTLN